MKEYRDNGTVLGEPVGGARSDSPLTAELRRVMQALTDAAAEEAGLQGRKGAGAERALARSGRWNSTRIWMMRSETTTRSARPGDPC